MQTSCKNMSRARETTSPSLRAQRSNRWLRAGIDGLLRCARNDVARAVQRNCSLFRRMGGAKRYPSPHAPVLMGIAALHPSYGYGPADFIPRPSLSISRYKPCSHSNSLSRGGDLWFGPIKPGIAEEIEPDGGSSKIT